MKENRRTPVIALRAAAVLLILVIMTTSIVSGRYARYTTTVSSSDSARVAKYDVSVDAITGDQLHLDPNGTATASYTFTVTSSSEVTVEYDLVIELPKALPDGIALSLAEGEDTIPLTKTDNHYKAENAGTFSPQGGTHTYTLTFTAEAPVGADELATIAIRVNARQVD